MSWRLRGGGGGASASTLAATLAGSAYSLGGGWILRDYVALSARASSFSFNGASGQGVNQYVLSDAVDQSYRVEWHMYGITASTAPGVWRINVNGNTTNQVCSREASVISGVGTFVDDISGYLAHASNISTNGAVTDGFFEMAATANASIRPTYAQIWYGIPGAVTRALTCYAGLYDDSSTELTRIDFNYVSGSANGWARLYGRPV